MKPVMLLFGWTILVLTLVLEPSIFAHSQGMGKGIDSEFLQNEANSTQNSGYSIWQPQYGEAVQLFAFSKSGLLYYHSILIERGEGGAKVVPFRTISMPRTGRCLFILAILASAHVWLLLLGGRCAGSIRENRV